jgi:hypothetical protein
MAVQRFNSGIPERFYIHDGAPGQLVPPETVSGIKQNSRYLKHKTKKGVVTLVRNTLVTLNRNQVVSLSGISI